MIGPVRVGPWRVGHDVRSGGPFGGSNNCRLTLALHLSRPEDCMPGPMAPALMSSLSHSALLLDLPRLEGFTQHKESILLVFKKHTQPLVLTLPLSPAHASRNFTMAEYDANAAGTNPWRPLPDDPVILHVIKEAIFIKDVISNMMLPTSLPDDDLGIVSEYLRNLETRRDITPLVFRESGIKDTVTSVSIRRDRIPVLQEPYDLRARFQALGRYWTDFRGPQEWEPAFDTTSVPPLIPLPDGERPPSITVDPEEQEHVDEDFDHYLRERRIKVEYYSQHPPRPMAFLPAPGVNSRDALGALHPEKELEAGLRSSGGQIQATQMFVPMYPSPNLQSLPIMPVSDDPERANARIARTQRLNRMYEIRSERRKAQKEYYAKLVEKTEEARREKRRLQQMEREMQNASV